MPIGGFVFNFNPESLVVRESTTLYTVPAGKYAFVSCTNMVGGETQLDGTQVGFEGQSNTYWVPTGTTIQNLSANNSNFSAAIYPS